MPEGPEIPSVPETGTAPAIPTAPPLEPSGPAAPPARHRNSKLIMAIVGLALVVLAAAGWLIFRSFSDRVNTDHAEHMEMSPSVHQIVHVRQKLIVGTDTNFEPMEFIDPKSQERIGFDIDLGRLIAQELNVPVSFVTVDFDSIFAPQNLGKTNVLTEGDVDILLDSVTITDARKQYYAFSQPYINVGQVAVTLKSNKTISSKSDLQGHSLAVAPSTSNETLAKSLTADDNIKRFTDPEDQVQAVLDGKADAMIVDLTNAKGLTSRHGQLKIATDPFTDEFYGVVIDKEKQDLVEQINQILNTLKQRGALESLRQKWFE